MDNPAPKRLGRPPINGPKPVRIPAYMEPELMDLLKAFAAREHCSMADAIRRILRERLKQ